MQYIDYTGEASVEIDEESGMVVKRFYADGFKNVVTAPLDRDGKTIELWERYYGEDGKAWTVVGFGRGTYPVIGKNGERGEETYRELNPEWLTHERPDTWSALWTDVRKGKTTQPAMRNRARKLFEREAS